MSSGLVSPRENERLNVLIKGQDPKHNSFSVLLDQARTETFESVATKIQRAYFEQNNINIYQLKLYKFDLADDQLENLQLSDEMSLSRRYKVATVWPLGEQIDDSLIHIIVECVGVTPSDAAVGAFSFPQIRPSGSSDAEIDSLNRQLKEIQLSFMKSLGSTTATHAAQLKHFRAQQKTSYFLANGRPARHTGLPITIFHPVFGQFLSNLRSTKPIPQDTLIRTVQYFAISQDIYNQEFQEAPDQSGSHQLKSMARDQTSQSDLSKLLGNFIMRVKAPGSQPDGAITGPGGSSVIIMEMKNEIGEGGCDPSVQVAQSYSRFWVDERVRDFFNQCCCPSILVAIAGPWMSVLGAIFLDRPLVQPLTDFLWVGYDPTRPSRLAHIARVFHSVSLAQKELLNYYENTPAMRGPRGRFFPYISHYTNSDGARTEFRYVRFLSGKYLSTGKPIFLAETRNVAKPMKIVVKFVQTYGAQAHQLLANAQLAPPLLYDGTQHPQDQPGPDHFMIVMGLVHGVDLSNCKEYPPPVRVLEDVDRALKLLHDRNLVFGDLRDPNVMVEMDPQGTITGAKLVDFDWCGIENVGKYPLDMNPNIPWAEGAGPGQLMMRSHDIDMRGKLSVAR